MYYCLYKTFRYVKREMDQESKQKLLSYRANLLVKPQDLPSQMSSFAVCGCVYVWQILFFIYIYFCVIHLVSFNMENYLRTRQLLIGLDDGRPIRRLREPLDLFSIPSTSCPFQGVRWPVECEVICDKIQHLGMHLLCFWSRNSHTASWFLFFFIALLCIDTEWDPPEPEPFYQQTGHERTPMPGGEEKGITVYCVDSGNAQHTECFCQTMFKTNSDLNPLRKVFILLMLVYFINYFKTATNKTFFSVFSVCLLSHKNALLHLFPCWWQQEAYKEFHV